VSTPPAGTWQHQIGCCDAQRGVGAWAKNMLGAAARCPELGGLAAPPCAIVQSAPQSASRHAMQAKSAEGAQHPARMPTHPPCHSHTPGPFVARCHKIRQFAREHHLTDRPHALLRLAKCYAIPASLYACQVWGTQFMKKGREFDNPLQTAHEGVLGVKRTTPNWAVLRECGQEPLQYFWFRVAAGFFQLSTLRE